MMLKRTLIGVDLGPERIHAAQCALEPEGPRIFSSLSYQRTKGSEEDLRKEADRLAGALLRRGFLGSDLVVCIPDDRLLISYLELPPRASGAPVEMLAKAELGRLFKRDPAAMETSVWELPIVQRKPGGASQYLAVACEHTLSDPLVRSFEAAGLIVRRIEPRMASLVRAGWLDIRRDASGSGDATFVLDIGSKLCQLVVIRSGAMIDRRLIDGVSVRDLIAELSGLHRMDLAQAELLLVPRSDQYRRAADGATQSETSSGDQKSNRPDIAAVIERFSGSLAKQISRCFEYVSRSYGGVGALALLLTGEHSDMPGLAEGLRASLGVRVEELTFGEDGQLVGPKLGAAMGAALPPLGAAA